MTREELARTQPPVTLQGGPFELDGTVIAHTGSIFHLIDGHWYWIQQSWPGGEWIGKFHNPNGEEDEAIPG